ncbi:hypothetical protein CPB86DRAFT_789338 [Serendipita vermifera]|nr:hypothetical protein CPB86DRAFT_789338 [Serendipita vermifera]
MVWTSKHTRLILILVPGPVLFIALMLLLYCGAFARLRNYLRPKSTLGSTDPKQGKHHVSLHVAESREQELNPKEYP